MRTSSKGHTRDERLRQHAAATERARRVAGAMGLLVREREARARRGATPLEVEFAGADVDGRALPAAVWVALRRDDADAAIDAMTAASDTQLLIEEREVMGEGYRLQSVKDTLPVPEPELLIAQVSRVVDVPLDVLAVIADWGADDPRTVSEIDDLLTSRFGPAACSQADTTSIVTPPHAVADGTALNTPTGHLTMTVADAAHVLRLDDAQTRALASLVRDATITLTAR